MCRFCVIGETFPPFCIQHTYFEILTSSQTSTPSLNPLVPPGMTWNIPVVTATVKRHHSCQWVWSQQTCSGSEAYLRSHTTVCCVRYASVLFWSYVTPKMCHSSPNRSSRWEVRPQNIRESLVWVNSGYCIQHHSQWSNATAMSQDRIILVEKLYFI